MGTDPKAVKHREIRSDSLNKILELLRMGTNPNTSIRHRICLWGIMSNPHVHDTILYLRTIRCADDCR